MTTSEQIFVIVPCCSAGRGTALQLEGLLNQTDRAGKPLPRCSYQIIIADERGCTDGAKGAARAEAAYPDARVRHVTAGEYGVALARKRGFAEALTQLERADGTQAILLSASADCRPHPQWVFEMAAELKGGSSDLCVSHCSYDYDSFGDRPRLKQVLKRVMQARHRMNALFGGLPDGTGFAVWADKYMVTGGIDVFYQLASDGFVPHASDDWDFGVKVRACGGRVSYAERARVTAGIERVQRALQDLTGRGDGCSGPGPAGDISLEDAEGLWRCGLKDLVHRYVILPLFLTPELFQSAAVRSFLSGGLADRLAQRIDEVKAETRLRDFVLIHSYKTPCYRLYFEFYEEILICLARQLRLAEISTPPLPKSLEVVRLNRGAEDWRRFVYYYCEDRESGDAHDYFAEERIF